MRSLCVCVYIYACVCVCVKVAYALLALRLISVALFFGQGLLCKGGEGTNREREGKRERGGESRGELQLGGLAN